MPLERIQKILAKAGIASRREAERMVIEGRITVNGKTVSLGFQADPATDHIKVDGKRLKGLEPKVTLLLNKPRGYLSTVEDPRGRPTVMDLLKVKWRVYPIGRLDYDAEGLLLLANDGDLAYRLSHPRFSVPRTYLAKLSGVPDEKELLRLRRGVMLDDGMAKAVSCRVVRRGEKNCWARVTVTEGKNRMVKRMFSAIGHRVLKLNRIGFGPIQLGSLPVGRSRPLTAEEIAELKKLTRKKQGVQSSELGVRSSSQE